MTLDDALSQAGYAWPVEPLGAIVPALRRRCLWGLAAWVERYVAAGGGDHVPIVEGRILATGGRRFAIYLGCYR